MATVKATDWFKVQGWMVSDLRLSGWELAVFGIIYSYASGETGVYTGGIAGISRWLGCSMNCARKYARRLVEKGLLCEEHGDVNGVPCVRFYVTPHDLKDTPHDLKDTPHDLKDNPSRFEGGILHDVKVKHNIETEYKQKKKSTKEDFDFLAALLGLGVTQKTATDWLAVRRKKGGVNTETAFNAVAREIAKSGKTAEECIALSAANSWIGFKAEYLKNETTNRYRIVTYGKQ